MDLVVELGDAAEHDAIGRKPGLEDQSELAARNDVGAATLAEKSAQDDRGRVRLRRVSHEVRRVAEARVERARRRTDAGEIIKVRRRPTSSLAKDFVDRNPRESGCPV